MVQETSRGKLYYQRPTTDQLIEISPRNNFSHIHLQKIADSFEKLVAYCQT